MIQNRLILLEGLPGLGKSTIAQFIALTLNGNSIKCKWYHENDKDNPFREIEDELTTSAEKAISLWKKFILDIKKTDFVHIIDSSFLQNIISTLIENDFDRDEIIKTAFELEEIISELNPLLIYFFYNNSNEYVNYLCKIRDDDWVKRHLKIDLETPFSLKRKLIGKNGWETLFSYTSDMYEDIINRFKIDVLKFETSQLDWHNYKSNILSYLKVDQSQEKNNKELFLKYCGKYQGTKQYINLKVEIKLYDCDLIISGFEATDKRLIKITNETFALESLPYTFTFVEKNDKIQKVIFEDNQINLEYIEIEKLI